MALTTAAAFDDFKARLLLTDAQSVTVRERRDITSGDLRDAFPSTSNLPLETAKLIGSAGRDTIIRPLDDVDLLAVFRNKDNIFDIYQKNSQSFVYRIRDSLKGYTDVKVVGARGQAVRLFYAKMPHVDVAPVFRREGGGYLLPDGKGGWLATDPDVHAQYMIERNRELNFRMKPLVRMLKQWNRSHSEYFRSFHLEVMTAKAFISLGNDSRENIRLFFDWAIRNVSVVDPAGHSGDLSSYMTALRRQYAIINLTSARDRAILAYEAEIDDDHKEAIRLWGIIFGSEFPAYG